MMFGLGLGQKKKNLLNLFLLSFVYILQLKQVHR